MIRAWNRVSGWSRALPQLLKARLAHSSNKVLSGITRLQRCLRHHVHHLPAGHQECKFIAWQLHLTGDMVQSPTVVAALLEVAVGMSEALTRSHQLLSRANWVSWVNDGPASGLRRQHRMSRVAIGWVRSRSVVMDYEDQDGQEQQQATDGSELQWEARRRDECPVPMSLQQTVDDQASIWSSHWACDIQMPECQWPTDMGPLPPMMVLDDFKEALRSFPIGLGLGWDGLHPRALLRLGDVTLEAILRLLFLCEVTGEWPTTAVEVLVSLLPKSADGVRCIGLFAWLPPK